MINLLLYDNELTDIAIHPLWVELSDKTACLGVKLGDYSIPDNIDILDYMKASEEFTAEEALGLEFFRHLQEAQYKLDRIQQCAVMLDFYPSDIRTAWFTPMTRGEY